jgi:hypothetical protein
MTKWLCSWELLVKCRPFYVHFLGLRINVMIYCTVEDAHVMVYSG